MIIKITGVDTSTLAAKYYLASLKVKFDKTDVDKLKAIPVDLSELSNLVNNEVVKLSGKLLSRKLCMIR